MTSIDDLDDMAKDAIGRLAHCLAALGGGALASVMRALATAGHPTDVLIMTAQSTESIIVYHSVELCSGINCQVSDAMQAHPTATDK